MASSPRSRASRTLPKTLTGVLAAVALAVLAALGIKTDWFHGKPSAPPTERPTAARTAPPGNLPNTPGSFESAKKVLYDTGLCRSPRDLLLRLPVQTPAPCVDLARCGLEALADKPSATDRGRTHFSRRAVREFPPLLAHPWRLSRVRQGSGKTVSGRECCQKVDPVFEAAHNDLFNSGPGGGRGQRQAQ
jgi:deoxyribonuclease-1